MSSAEALQIRGADRSRLADAVLGLGSVQRRAVKRLLFFTGAYGVLWLLLALAVSFGAAERDTLTAVTCGGAGQIVFYAVLRSGLTLRMKDPLLCFPQALYGVACIAMTYGLQSSGQSPPLQVLFLILVYDLHRLSQRQIALLASVAAVLLASAAVGRWYLRPETTDLPQEAFGMLMAVVAMPALAVIGRLVRSVHQRRLAQEVELDKTLKELRVLSQRDALTGAFNRRYLMEMMGDELKRYHRSGCAFSVAMLDIDLFKRINDKFGHAVGDAVLQQLTVIAGEVLRESDVLARWGGEEFLVLLPEASAGEARDAIEKLQQRTRSYDWAVYAAGLQVTFSCGVAEHSASSSLELTIGRADSALYRAKGGGRDRVEMDASSTAPVTKRNRRVACRTDASRAVSGRPGPSCAAGSASAGRGHAAASLEMEAGQKRAPSGNHSWSRRLGDLVLGTEPGLRLSVQLCLVSSLLYACWIAALLFSVAAGYMSPTVMPFVVGYYVIGMVAFYPLVRIGYSARSRAVLVQVQILWAASALMIAYPFNPTLRAAMMEMLCMQLMFGLFALRRRRLIFTGVAIISLQLLMLTAATATGVRPRWFNAGEETFKVLYSCVVISLITWITVLRSRDKARMRERKGELDVAVDRVHELVTRDPLTGLFNRKHMQGLLEREEVRHSMGGKTFCVALIDLDHFKRINDTHGHQVGDRVLHDFAAIAQASLRETDRIARWGGEEFLVLLLDTPTEADGKVSMDRLHASIDASIRSAAGPSLGVTFSAGLAVHDAGIAVRETLERADRALYRAKDCGRNRTAFASQLGCRLPDAQGQEVE